MGYDLEAEFDCPIKPLNIRRTPVSYTHLDVYKRQVLFGIILIPKAIKLCKLKYNGGYVSAYAAVEAAVAAVRRGESGSFPPEYTPDTQKLREPMPVSYTHLLSGRMTKAFRARARSEIRLRKKERIS